MVEMIRSTDQHVDPAVNAKHCARVNDGNTVWIALGVNEQGGDEQTN